MNKVVSDIRLFLFTCSGEDNYILKRCNESMQLRFALIGFFVLAIFIGCFLSAYCFISSLFHGAAWISLPLGIVWGAIIVNIYLLLLHTISPAIIPALARKKKKKVSPADDESNTPCRFLTLSMFCRMGFMMLLAIIIAQPLNVIVLESSVVTSIQKHKIKERVKLYMANNSHLIEEELQNHKEFNQRLKMLPTGHKLVLSSHVDLIDNKIYNDSLFANNVKFQLSQLDKLEHGSSTTAKMEVQKEQILTSLEDLLNKELDSDNDFVNSLNSVSFPDILQEEGDAFKNRLLELINEKTENYNTLNNLLNQSNFYVKTIQLLLHENPLSWLLTFAVCLVFLLPIYFKYKVRDLSAKLFSENDYHKDIQRLRAELIHTTDFNWLEKKIKSAQLHEIRTSDYYFQRMFIEHKIILEEYESTKRQFSERLTANIKKYNQNSLSRLLPLLQKLKSVSLKRYTEYYAEIIAEYKEEIVIKYEYWLDMPFRTKRVAILAIKNTEIGLLDFLYKKRTKDQNEEEKE